MWVQTAMTARDREMLQSMLVLLVSMAGLADRACSLPAPACFPVLRILHLAQCIALHTLLGLARGAPHLAAPLMLQERDDSRSLAQRLLLLARTAELLLEQTSPALHYAAINAGGEAHPLSPKQAHAPATTGSLAWLALRRAQTHLS